MSDQPDDAPTEQQPAPQADAREPADSAQRRLVDGVAAYEVDPPPPTRATGAAEPS